MKQVAVIGASGAIGSSIAQSFIDNGHNVYTFARQPRKLGFAQSILMDITCEQSIEAALSQLDARLRFDEIWLTTGVLHHDSIQPEKTIRTITAETMQSIFQVNCFGPALVMRYFLPKLKLKQTVKFLALSARVGSISDNHLGGWYSYRASKAALNMMLKTASIEYARKNPKAIIAGLHPGTVDSALSKPFQSNVNQDKLFSPHFSAQKLISVAQHLTPEDSGFIFDWKGEKISY